MDLLEQKKIAAALRKLEQKKLLKAFDAFHPESRPSSKQKVILKDIGKIKYRFCVAGNQSGKSQLAAREIAWILTDSHPYWQRPYEWNSEPLLIIIAGQDLTMMATELWGKKIRPFLTGGDWKEIRQGNTLKKAVNQKTGDTLVFVSHADGSDKNRKHMQGYVAHYVWLDEMPAHHKILEELQLRVQAKNGFMLATFTPKFRNDNIRRIVDNSTEPVAKKYKMSKFDNPIFANSYDEEMTRLAGYSEAERNTILYGDWSTGDSAVYQFNYDLMTVEELPSGYSRGWRHVESVDPALKSKFGYTLWAECPQKGIWYLISDKYITGIYNPADMLKRVRQLSSGYNIVRKISDPHEAWYIGAASQEGISYISPFDKNNRKGELIKGLQAALSSGKIKIARWCTDTIDELQSCQWSENADRIINSSSYHNLDCAQYFCDLIPQYDPIRAVRPWHQELREGNARRKKSENLLKKAATKSRINNRTIKPIKGWGVKRFNIR